jgi:hypothetical protein
VKYNITKVEKFFSNLETPRGFFTTKFQAGPSFFCFYRFSFVEMKSRNLGVISLPIIVTENAL